MRNDTTCTRIPRCARPMGVPLLVSTLFVGFVCIVLVAARSAHAQQSTPEVTTQNPTAESEPPATPPLEDSDPPAAEQDSDGDAATDGAETDDDAAIDRAKTDGDAAQTAKHRYGWLAVVPAVVAILLTLLTRQVVPALALGVIVGAFMLLPPPADAGGFGAWTIAGFKGAAETYTMGAILSPKDGYGHLKIIIFTLTIGFMVGVMGRNGGTAGMVELVAGRAKSPRRSALTAWLAGMVVFFDDYANTMIVGPTMRSVFDKVKLSRAKLAYIVDSTAAPVASIALIGTWVGAEIGYIAEGLDKIHAEPAGTYGFLAGQNGMTVFIQSLAYRFYPVLALVLVFLIALTGRDFGPMRRSESSALAGTDETAASKDDDSPDKPKPNAWLGFLPVLCLVGVTLYMLWWIGWHADGTQAVVAGEPYIGEKWEDMQWFEQAGVVISNSDPYVPIFYGAFAAATLALILTTIARACPMRDAADGGLDGMSRMFPAIVILVLAWALSAVVQKLELGDVVKDWLQAVQFDPRWMPLAVFACAAGISFATGTSWGTMGILCPVTVEVTAKLVADLDPETATSLFSAAVGSVLAGAVFGDHCSPISDTTVLSSTATGCRHEEHVWTQMPYAIVAALAAMGVADVLCSRYDQPWYYGLGAGAIVLLCVVLILGRRATPPAEPV